MPLPVYDVNLTDLIIYGLPLVSSIVKQHDFAHLSTSLLLLFRI